ncbi:hypothetical protein Tco_0905156 [Tanacetum coccineum]
MESIRSKFFNGVDSSDRKILWVALDNVLASKLNGGLGVSSFFALNRALLLMLMGEAQSFLAMATLSKICERFCFDFSTHCKQADWDRGSCTSFGDWLANQNESFFVTSSSFSPDVRDGAERQHGMTFFNYELGASKSSSKDRWTCDCVGMMGV